VSGGHLFADPLFAGTATATFAVGFGGIALTWLALRGQRR
jgi:hypothetical protein